MADISKVILPDNGEYDLKDATARDHAVYYGTCGTAGGTVAKVATVTGVTELKTGLTIAVKFTSANTVASPTLNVNSLGAVAIKRYGTTAPSTSAASSWNAGAIVTLTYDGTYWVMHDWLNTTYSSMTVAEYEAGTGTTARLITPARLKDAIEYNAPVTSVNGSTGAVTVSVPTKTSDLTNDSGFITTETDPTVPAWAKASTKPTYTADEVGAIDGIHLPLEIEDNCPKTIYNVYVSGSAVYLLDGEFSPVSFLTFANKATYGLEAIYAQVINGATTFAQANARAFVIAGLDMSSASVKLVSVYDGTVYTATLQDTGNGLIGTFASQALPTAANITAWNGAVTTANTALSGVNGSLIYDTEYSISNGVASFVPHVYKAGAEVTTDYATSCFTWKYRLIDGSEVSLTTKSNRGCDVTISNMGYGGHVIGSFTPA